MIVRDASVEDRASIVAMLTRAFAEDPAMRYIFPDATTRLTRLPKLFGLLFDSDSVGMRLVTGTAQAATLWRPPGVAEMGRMALLTQLLPLVDTFGSALFRAMRLSDAIDAHYPREPFWYLHIAGVDPGYQGRGLGSASIREGIARSASDGLPAYLETTVERNVVLYQSLGFDVTSQWHVPGGGPKFWSMLRRP